MTEPALRLEGSLGDVPLDKLLGPCREHLFTGAITVKANGRQGELALNGGIVDEAKWGDQTGDAATDAMKALKDGSFEVVPRLPDLSFGGRTVKLEGVIKDAPLAAIMRHVEENALSCTVIVEAAGTKGEIKYKMGEITEVRKNGTKDEDAIAELVGLANGVVSVRAAGVEFSVPGAKSISAAAPAAAAAAPAPKVEAKKVEEKKPEPKKEPVVEAKKAEPEKKVEEKKPEPKKEPVVEAKKPDEKKAEPKVEKKAAAAAAAAHAPAAAAAAAKAPDAHADGGGFSFGPLIAAAIITAILTYLIVEVLF